MLELAYTRYITATDLADYLVKNHEISFRKAYQITASVVNYAEKKKKKLQKKNHKKAEVIYLKILNKYTNILWIK